MEKTGFLILSDLPSGIFPFVSEPCHGWLNYSSEAHKIIPVYLIKAIQLATNFGGYTLISQIIPANGIYLIVFYSTAKLDQGESTFRTIDFINSGRTDNNT